MSIVTLSIYHFNAALTIPGPQRPSTTTQEPARSEPLKLLNFWLYGPCTHQWKDTTMAALSGIHAMHTSFAFSIAKLFASLLLSSKLKLKQIILLHRNLRWAAMACVT